MENKTNLKAVVSWTEYGMKWLARITAVFFLFYGLFIGADELINTKVPGQWRGLSTRFFIWSGKVPPLGIHYLKKVENGYLIFESTKITKYKLENVYYVIGNKYWEPIPNYPLRFVWDAEHPGFLTILDPKNNSPAVPP